MRLGIDLGGTKTEVVALDHDGSERHRERRPTPSHDYSAIVDHIASMVHSAERALATRCSVGIGVPGSLSPATGWMRNANTTCLNGMPLGRDLEAALGRAVRLENDANCFALSEASDGAAAGARIVFGVIVGTGTGGGIVIDGELLSGATAIAGEWGHNPLPWPTDDERPGPRCYCGKHGCIETFLSGPALARDHAHSDGGRAAGSALDAREIAARAQTGDRAARQTIERYVDRLARGLASVINVLDPDVVVLGGGLSQITELYSTVPPQLEPYVFSDTIATRIVPARHGDASGVRGAARLWPPGP